jgi:NADP-dependent 3-hydroxy acid dehydrogenase YdfG
MLELFNVFCLSKYSLTGLWAVVNNAGYMTLGPLEWFKMEEYKRMADVNLWGLVDVTKTFLPLVKKAKGRVVNFSSVAGTVCYRTSRGVGEG